MSRPAYNKKQSKRVHVEDDIRDSPPSRRKKNKPPSSPDLINGDDFPVTGTGPLLDVELRTPDTADDFATSPLPPRRPPFFPIIAPTASNDQPRKNQAATEQTLVDRQFPEEIYNVFSKATPHVTLITKLSDIQRKEDEYCMPGDRAPLTKQRAFPRSKVIDYFEKNHSLQKNSAEGQQIVAYLKSPVLQQAAYGILLYNSAQQIFLLQDSREHWTAPKAYRRIQNRQLETIKEAAARAFAEQIKVPEAGIEQAVDDYDIHGRHSLDLNSYFEYQFADLPWGELARTIGLFAVKVDEKEFAFNLKDPLEYQNGRWVAIEEVLNGSGGSQQTKFNMLKPFVESLQSYLVFTNEMNA